MANLLKLSKILRQHFTPKILEENVTNIIGYGSGVFKQTTSSSGINQIDLIITVKNAQLFHEGNYQINRNDYAGLPKIIGAKYLYLLNKFIFPWHSNHVTISNIYPIKYSIISQQIFIKDLYTWNYLSFAGRLHKPVEPIIPYTPILQRSMKKNYQSALSIALFRLYKKHNKNISFQTIMTAICQLSYMGDIRNSFGVENPNKIANIVKSNMKHLQNIYYPILEEMKIACPRSVKKLTLDQVVISYDPQLISYLIKKLPQTHLQKLNNQTNNPNYQNKSLVEKIILLGFSEIVTILQRQIISKNRKTSFRMAIQNFFGSSLLKNIKYLSNKLNKKNDK